MPTVILRPWQRAAYERFRASADPDYLAVATPGAGKTTFALACARASLAEEPRTLVVVAPTSHLKMQWSLAAHRLGLQLDPDWSPGDGLARDVHGLVTTYQQIATGNTAAKLRRTVGRRVRDPRRDPPRRPRHGLGRRHPGRVRARRPPTVAVGHTLSQRRRADPVRALRRDRRTATWPTPTTPTATPMPSATVAWCARCTSRVSTVRWSGRTAAGDVVNASFQDELTKDQMSMRLRTALSLEGEWMPSVLARRQRAAACDPQRAPRRRRARHRHRPGPRAGHRATAPRSVRNARRRRRQRRSRPRRGRSPSSRRTTVRGWSRCGWCRRASTFLACASACSPPPRRPSSSSARPSAGSSAGRPGGPARRRTSTSPTTRGCGQHAFADRRGAPPRAAAAGHDDGDEFALDGGLDDQTHPDDAAEQLTLFAVVSATATDVTVHTVTEEGVRFEPLFSPDDLHAPRYDDELEIAEPRFVADPMLSSSSPRFRRRPAWFRRGRSASPNARTTCATRNAHVAKRLVDITGWGARQGAG